MTDNRFGANDHDRSSETDRVLFGLLLYFIVCYHVCVEIQRIREGESQLFRP